MWTSRRVGRKLMQTKKSPPRVLPRAGLANRSRPGHQEDHPQDKADLPGSQALEHNISRQREIQWSWRVVRNDAPVVRRADIFEPTPAQAPSTPLSFPLSVSVRRTEMGKMCAGSPNRKRVRLRVFPGNGHRSCALPQRPGPQATTKKLSYKAGASQAPRVANPPTTG